MCRPFTESYLRGETPNPCILCNPSVKFKSLIDCADRLGAPFVATGHYARARDGMLFKGMPANDQSYMLCRLRRDQVERMLLPLGEYEKKQVRALAGEFGIPVAHKPDSMEICFIPDRDYIGWIGRRADLPGPGDVTLDGEVVARHEGYPRYTVGQRLPGLWRERKLYVAAIRPEKNELIAALWDDLFKTEVRAPESQLARRTPGRAAARLGARAPHQMGKPRLYRLCRRRRRAHRLRHTRARPRPRSGRRDLSGRPPHRRWMDRIIAKR